MKRSVAALCLILAAAQAAEAQQTRLRAIEQPTLSRISLPLDGAEFQLEKIAPRQFDLLITRPGLRFDTRQIFPDRLVSRVISARQIKEQDASRLRFVLNCDCQADTRVARGSLLIEFYDPNAVEADEPVEEDGQQLRQARLSADLAPGTLEPEADEGTQLSDQAQSETETATVDQTPAPQRAPRPFAKPEVAASRAEETVSDANAATQPIENIEIVESGVTVSEAETASGPATPPDPDQNEEIRVARQKLIEQLTRAAEQGLLEFALPDDEDQAEALASGLALQEPEGFAAEADLDAVPEIAPRSERVSSTEAPTRSEPKLPAPRELPVRARTAIDRDFVADRSDTIVPVEPCRANRLLVSIDWPDPQDPAAMLARLRGEILGEFDQPRPEVVARLATLYISLGFGVEAQKLLVLYGATLEERALYQDLASIVDGGTVAPGIGIAEDGPCSGAVALWLAAAGLRGLEDLKTAETDPALLDAFALLPLSMRKLLGPRILTHAVDEQNVALARRIDQLLQRSGGRLGTAQNLALARLIALEGRPEAAEAIFAQIAAARGDLATEALLRLAESKLARGAPISDAELQELSFAAFTHRSDPKGRALRLVELQGRAGGSGLPGVLMELRRYLEEAPQEAADYRDIGHLLLEQSDLDETGGAAYAQAVLNYAGEISTSADGDTARARVATQLTEAGLANLALQFLEPALGRRDPDVKLAAGKALVALGKGEAALDRLAGLDADAALETQIRAHRLAETPERALDLLAASRDRDDRAATDIAPDAATDLAWQAGDWGAAAREGSAARRLLASFMAEDAGAPEDIDPDRSAAFLTPPELPDTASLRASEEILGSSATVREIIEEALGDG
ncbi:MAG: hypothetical protein AAGE80_07775 [Pseudomonadota bacterium]